VLPRLRGAAILSSLMGDAIRYAFSFIALLLALIIGVIGVVIYFANAPKTSSEAVAPMTSSSAAN